MDNVDDLHDLMEKLESASGYMLTVSILDKDGKLNHRMIMKDFLKSDMLPSHFQIKKLLIKNLEED